MAAPVRLREDFDGPRLRALATYTRDVGQLRRFLALTETCDGRSRGATARARIGSTTATGRDKQGFRSLIRQRNSH